MAIGRLSIAVLLIMVIVIAATPGLAWIGSKLGVTMGDIRFGHEILIQKPSATLFHRQNTAASDVETLAISFPGAATSSAGAPAIAQTTDSSLVSTDTGFFKANWCYTALTNLGGYDVAGDVSTWHPMADSEPLGAGVNWPYMNQAGQEANTMKFRPAINTTPETTNVNISRNQTAPGNISTSNTSLPTNRSTPGNLSTNRPAPVNQSVNRSATGSPPVNNSPVRQSPVTQSTPNRDYRNMTAKDIENMPGLEKLYRNANLKNTIPQSYKGTVDRPTTIAPLKNPMDIIKPVNKPQVISDSRNMTAGGTVLKTLFWDL
jgi:hypothetical protein